MAISDTLPPASFSRGGRVVIPINVTTESITDPETGKARTRYLYDEAEGQDVVGAQQMVDSKAALKSAGLAVMSYAQLDAYIQANVTSLETAKAFLKKLAMVALVLVKQQER